MEADAIYQWNTRAAQSSLDVREALREAIRDIKAFGGDTTRYHKALSSSGANTKEEQ
jgi:hypothetical protein